MKLENEELQNKWSDYNQIRLTGNKKLANKLLDTFIQCILVCDEYTIEDFVYRICSVVLQEKFISTNGTDVSEAQVRIQHPLFQKVILPVLIKKYKENDPLYIRWIAQFEQFFYSDGRTANRFLEDIDDNLRDAVQFSAETNQYEKIRCRYFSTESFLEKSFELESDQITLKLLLQRLATDINYYTHELPSGILVDADVFLKEIQQFQYYYEQYNDKRNWTQSLQEWTDIAEHWKIYSSQKEICNGFEEYLNKNITTYDL